MATITARQSDGTVIRFEDRPLNQGGEKTVFPSTDGRHVVAFFHGRMADRMERVDRLTRILTRYNPTLGPNGRYWNPYFCWPTGVVDGDGVPTRFAQAYSLAQPALGVVAPVYRGCFYFRDSFGNRQEKEVKWFTGRKATAFVPEHERGTLLTRLQICTRLARAVRRMHFAGLAHSDLSNKNVLVDPRHGDACVIDIDSLVVPGVAPPAVLGTPGYIAPEVLAGRAQPSIETDRHALAVLIYQLLLHRHPLQGRKVHSVRSAEEDEQLSMGAKALFVEHPTDRSNPPLTRIAVPYTRLGPFLTPLLRRAFVDALHLPGRRPDAAEWEVALYRTLQLVHPSASGRAWTLLGPGLPLDVPDTGERIVRDVPVARFQHVAGQVVRDEGQCLTLFHHLTIHRWHWTPGMNPDEHADRAPVGYVSQHQGKWWLVHLGAEPLHVVGGDAVATNGVVELVPGLELDGGAGRRWRLEWLGR